MSPRRQFMVLWAVVSASIVSLAAFAPAMAAALPPCPMKSISGLPCPTCGTTRAALALADFDLVAAFRWSPLAALGWIGFLGGGAAAGVACLAGTRLPQPPWRLGLPWRLGILAAVAANWLYLILAGR